MILCTHTTGNPNSRLAMSVMARNGLLAEAHTTLAWNPAHWLARALPAGIAREFSRRHFPEEVLPKVKLHPFREVLRMARQHTPLRLLGGFLDRYVSVRAVVMSLGRASARAVRMNPNLRGVYCWEDLALETFRAAKERGITTFYELPTPYWRVKKRLLAEEKELRPEWLPTLAVFEEEEAALAQKDEELRLADHIIVPSEFVRESLREAPAFSGKVHVFPYAIPATAPTPGSEPAPGTLRVIYAGNLGQAKGMSYLAEAMQQTHPGVRLTLAGGKINSKACAPLEVFLAKHDYRGRVPNAELIQMMADFDVLVLPTLYEGLSLALLEGMSRGLTVVTTPHSGITGIIQDGRDGFIVPVRDGKAIADRLNLLCADHARLRAMKQAAQITAQSCSVENYSRNLRNCLAEGLSLSSQ